jgi:hypothetical protein
LLNSVAYKFSSLSLSLSSLNFPSLFLKIHSKSVAQVQRYSHCQLRK